MNANTTKRTVKVRTNEDATIECEAGCDANGNVRLWPVNGPVPYLIVADCPPGEFARAVGEARSAGAFEDNYVLSDEDGPNPN